MKQMVRNWRELETLGDKVVHNNSTNTTEFGDNVEVDGNLEVGTAVFTDKIYEKTTNANINLLNNTWIGTTANRKTLKVTGDITSDNTIYATNIILGGRLGQAISQDTFLTINDTEHITLSNFSAYKIGQFVYVKVDIETSSFTAYGQIFTVANAYKPKSDLYVKGVSEAWGDNGYIRNANRVLTNLSSATSNTSKWHLNLFYEVA